MRKTPALATALAVQLLTLAAPALPADAKAISVRGRDFVAAWKRGRRPCDCGPVGAGGGIREPVRGTGPRAGRGGEAPRRVALLEYEGDDVLGFTRETVRLFGPNAGIVDWDVVFVPAPTGGTGGTSGK